MSKKTRGGWTRDNRGEKNPMWGKRHSLETRRKISERNQGRPGNSGSFTPGPRYDLRKRVQKTCIVCEAEFEIKISHSSFTFHCSKKCAYVTSAKKRIGKKIHTEAFKQRLRERNWRGGATPENRLIRRSAEYKEWRENVFRRDNYTCQKCSKIGGELNADHDLPFSLFPDLRFEVLNGQTLCVPCHKNKPNTIKQLKAIHLIS